jgi:hypothetical protein
MVVCPFCSQDVQPQRDAQGLQVCPECRNTGRSRTDAPASPKARAAPHTVGRTLALLVAVSALTAGAGAAFYFWQSARATDERAAAAVGEDCDGFRVDSTNITAVPTEMVDLVAIPCEGESARVEWLQVAGPAVLLPAGTNPASFMAPSTTDTVTLAFVARTPEPNSTKGPLAEGAWSPQAGPGCRTLGETRVCHVFVTVTPGGRGGGACAPFDVRAGPEEHVLEGAEVRLPFEVYFGEDGRMRGSGDSCSFDVEVTQVGGPVVDLWGTTFARGFTAPDVPDDRPTTLLFDVVARNETASISLPLSVVVYGGSGNHPPVARAGDDSEVSQGDVCGLNAERSVDPDGDPLDIRWTQIAGPAVELSAVQGWWQYFWCPMEVTELTFMLTVSDGQLSSTDLVTVRVGENHAPVADAGPDMTVRLGATVTLDANGSVDADGDPMSYWWMASPLALDDDRAARASFVADRVGTFEFRLSVHDGTTFDDDVVVVTVTE